MVWLARILVCLNNRGWRGVEGGCLVLGRTLGVLMEGQGGPRSLPAGNARKRCRRRRRVIVMAT